MALFPRVPGNAVDALASANKALQTSFSTGAPPCTGIASGDAVCPMAVGLNTFPSGTLKTPLYYQYSAGLEQQVGGQGAVWVDFVGTRGLHEPYQVELNGYQNVCAGCFAPYAYSRPLDQRFGGVNEFRSIGQMQPLMANCSLDAAKYFLGGMTSYFVFSTVTRM